MITVYTEDQTFDLAIAYLSKQFPNAALGPLSFLGQLARAVAQLVGAIQRAIKDVDNDSVPGQTVDINGVIKARCSSEALDAWAFVFGLPTNRGASLFGRKTAQAATGATGNATGVPTTMIPAGTRLTDPSGAVVCETTGAVTIPGGGSIQVTINAVTAGAASNLPNGTVLTWQSPPLGLDPKLTLGAPLSGGFDLESDLDLLNRILARLQFPPKGGTASDWREWAETATDTDGTSLGISRAYVYPLRDGTGSVTVVPTQVGMGASRDIQSVNAAKLQSYLEGLRIATDTVYVVRPSFPSGQKLTIRLKIVPSARFPYDWNDSTTTTTVSGALGATTLVISGGTPPAALQNELTLLRKPRLQLLLANSALPFQPRVLSAAANTPGAGQCTLTLDTALPAVVGGGLTVYAGGGAVEPVATAVLAYLNNVGPSNQSGYADPLDAWESLVTIGRIAQSALQAADVDGTRILVYSPRVGMGVGVAISVNGGAYGADDFTLFDNVPGSGPQLPEPEGVLVIRG